VPPATVYNLANNIWLRIITAIYVQKVR